MGVGDCRPVSWIWTVKRFYVRDLFLGQGIDILTLQTRPTPLHCHAVAVRVGRVVERQDPFQ